MNQTEAKIILLAQRKLQKDFLPPVLRAVTHSADGGAVWLALAGALSAFRQTRKLGAGLFSTLALDALLVNGVLKRKVDRERPYERETRLQVLCKRPKDPSFPSGHTAVSFAAATYLYGAGYKKWALVALPYAGLVGISRVYLGVHYPSDVVAGAILGSLIGLTGKKLFLKE